MTDDEKKKALQAAIKKEVRPFMVVLGFTPDKRPFEDRVTRKIGLYVRKRDDYTDELLILWRSYGRPIFMIEFWTDQEERMRAAWKGPFRFHPKEAKRIFPRRRSLLRPLISEPWYGREKTIGDTMRVAKARLAELDTFLRTGAPRTHLTW
jgi:hypothetical protein